MQTGKIKQIIPNTNNVIQLAQHYSEQNDKSKKARAIAKEILQSKATTSLIDHDHKMAEKSKEVAREIVKAFPEEPTNCCMTGCANCVWLVYAQEISDYYKDGGEKAESEIMKKVNDPNIRAFLMHELRMRRTES